MIEGPARLAALGLGLGRELDGDRAALLRLLLALEDADLDDLLVIVVGDDASADALLADVLEPLVLEPALDRLADLELLLLLVELGVHDLDVVGGRQGRLLPLLALLGL